MVIQPNQSSDYYHGARDAVYQYAIHRDGVMYVGCQIKTYKQALEEIAEFEATSVLVAQE